MTPNADIISQLRDRHEFLTFIHLIEDRPMICGVVQNSTSKIISVVDILQISTPQLRHEFIECADTWWWTTNRLVPIDCFMGDRFEAFRPYVKQISKKLVEGDVIGPMYSMADLVNRRIRKKCIPLNRD